MYVNSQEDIINLKNFQNMYLNTLKNIQKMYKSVLYIFKMTIKSYIDHEIFQ